MWNCFRNLLNIVFCYILKTCNLICNQNTGTYASFADTTIAFKHFQFLQVCRHLQYIHFKMCQPFISYPIILFQKAKESLWETFSVRSLQFFHSRIHKLIIAPLCHSCNSEEESTSRKSTPRISPTGAVNQNCFFLRFITILESTFSGSIYLISPKCIFCSSTHIHLCICNSPCIEMHFCNHPFWVPNIHKSLRTITLAQMVYRAQLNSIFYNRTVTESCLKMFNEQIALWVSSYKNIQSLSGVLEASFQPQVSKLFAQTCSAEISYPCHLATGHLLYWSSFSSCGYTDLSWPKLVKRQRNTLGIKWPSHLSDHKSCVLLNIGELIY